VKIHGKQERCMPRITKRVVDGAAPGPVDYFLWCDDLPGFGVRIFPSGKRSYLVQYRANGRSRRLTIGLHGRLTTEEARRLAMARLGEVAKGEDPAEERATRRKALTMRELCEQYLAAADRGLILGKKGGPKKPSTLARDRGAIARHILPLLGNRRVIDLTRPDIVRFLRDVTTGKTAVVEKTGKLRGKSIVEGGAGTAARTVGLLGGILSYAVEGGIIQANPVHGVRRPADGRRTLRLTPATYRLLGLALERMDAAEATTPATMIRLLALTGCRLGEIASLTWPEVDAAGHALRLKDGKEGASVRPVGAAALAVLAAVPRQPGSPFVSPGTRPDRPYAGLSGAWSRWITDDGLKGVTRHTLRHSFASVAGDLGYSEATTAALLGHAAGSVTGRYTHLIDAVLIAAADRIAGAIWGFMTGSDPGPVKA
jgi:integrase